MLVIIRGAGDIATGIALRLHRAGYRLILTDLPQPTSIRRTVCFSEAIWHGRCTVEDVEAVLADPESACVRHLHPAGVVDAILAKRNLGTAITDAPVVVAAGPGFTAGVDCHAAVETMRGHTLGRVLYIGSPLPNTGVPGVIGGQSALRILRAPAAGVFCPKMEIGQMVQAGDVAATVDGVPMVCAIDGCLRGLLHEGLEVFPGMKCGDVDPRANAANCLTASDKALAVGGGVLEALLHFGCLPDRQA